MVVKTELKKAKSELRTTIKSRLAALSQEQFTIAGNTAAQQLPQIPGWNKFRSALAFLSMKDEIDTRPIMETILNAGKPLFAPKVEKENLVFYQINKNDMKSCTVAAGKSFPDSICREPAADPACILTVDNFPVLVITPGMAFDRRYYRMGRGRGYYDRFFAALDESGRNYTALGLCMNCQLVDKIPVDTWDKKMDMLLTESGLI